MSRVETLTEGVTLYCGDCLDVLPAIQPNSADAGVTDPPYGLGFMGKAWDHGVPGVAYWKQVFRILKPGAHLLAFGGTRTSHRMACAIEDAGFEIRDTIMWVYGSGFPKSLDVSKAIDKAAGAEREILRTEKFRDIRNGHGRGQGDGINASERDGPEYLQHAITAPATESAREWEGWGTALKPACEPIVLARKPLSESTVAANVLKWGTGALNIDGCRVDAGGEKTGSNGAVGLTPEKGWNANSLPRDVCREQSTTQGRWPANVIHDGSDEVVGAFPENDGVVGACHDPNGSFGYHGGAGGLYRKGVSDSGSAARFFYTAKADADDRLGSKHPTVKPLDLMQYLVRLVTPPKGLVVDPFAGTGTTGEACIREGMRAILIERETEYQDDIRRRMALAMAGTYTRQVEAMKAKLKGKPIDMGPLFK